MARHLITPGQHVAPDLREPRMHPCKASGTGPGAQECGATPASVWRRFCHHGHSREVRLCGSHAALITRGLGSCAECAARGFDERAFLTPVELLLAR